MNCVFAATTVIVLSIAKSTEPSAPVRPIRPAVGWVDCNFNQVWAFYPYTVPKPTGEIGWNEQVTSDTASKLRILRTLLSPTRDRYFYVEIMPQFKEFVGGRMLPMSDGGSDESPPPDNMVPWDKNEVAMRLHVRRLSGEPVTMIPLLRSYFGGYGRGAWLGDHWICLHDRSGKIGGNVYCLFVNVDTGEKRLVGLPIYDDRATWDGRFVLFTHGVLYVNFRPVYPFYDEPLPDFGEEAGWKAYKEKYLVRKDPRPGQRARDHRIRQYELTPDGKKVVLLDHRDWTVWEPNHDLPREQDRPKVPLEKVPAPRLVVVDLAKIEATKAPAQYARIIDLPKDNRADLRRDDQAKQIQVYAGDGRTIIWRKTFAELEKDAP